MRTTFLTVLSILTFLLLASGIRAADNYGSLRRGNVQGQPATVCTYQPGRCGNSSCEKVLVCITATPMPSGTNTGTPSPSPKAACDKSVKDMQFSGTCDTRNFKYQKVSYTCADGTSGTIDGGDSCSPVPKLVHEIRKACRNHTSCSATSPTGTGTPSPAPCLKHMGDANCDGATDMIDFEIWRQEFKGEQPSLNADFNNDKTVDLVDFEIWRAGFFPEQLPPMPIETPVTDTPTASASATPTVTPELTCGWCGSACVPFETNKMCPMMLPNDKKTCAAVGLNGKTVCAEITVDETQ